MTSVLTVTINPALDVSSHTPHILPTHKLRCDGVSRHAGGGGINVARVLHCLGAPVSALAPLGGTTGALVAELLQDECVELVNVAITGHTRESFTVAESDSGHEYRFVLPGPVLEQAEWVACLDALSHHPTAAQWVVASGSLPPGVPDDFYAQLALRCKQLGRRLIVDTSGPALAAALRTGVYLVKPSVGEMRTCSGLALHTVSEIQSLAQSWVHEGRAAVVVVSMGEQGALMVSRECAVMAHALKVPVLSAVGAGDSFVAGFVYGLLNSEALVYAFECGMACAAAAVQTRNLAQLNVAAVLALLPQVVSQDLRSGAHAQLRVT